MGQAHGGEFSRRRDPGVLDGTESLERFERLDDGSKEGYADVRMTGVTQGKGGSVDLVAPFDIHAEQGGPTRSVAVIVRSERVAGKVLQGRYVPDEKRTYQGEGPTQVPFGSCISSKATAPS